MNDFWTIGFTGAALGGVLGWPLFRRGHARLVGALLILGACASALIAARHGEVVPARWDRVAEHATSAGNLVFWAVVVLLSRRALGRQTPSRYAAALVSIPLAGYVVASFFHAGGPPRFIFLLPFGSAAAIYVALLWRQQARAGRAIDALTARMIGFAMALSLAQAARTFFSDVVWLREIVPITMTAGFLSIAALGVRRTLSASAEHEHRASQPYARSALDEGAAARLLARLDHGMMVEHWYREPALALADIARRLESKPHLVSQALNQSRGVSLADYLAAFRVAEARRLLADAASDRYTIDWLAEAAGFRSRSAFYKAFKAHEGMTPTAFRAQLRERSGPDATR